MIACERLPTARAYRTCKSSTLSGRSAICNRRSRDPPAFQSRLRPNMPRCTVTAVVARMKRAMLAREANSRTPRLLSSCGRHGAAAVGADARYVRAVPHVASLVRSSFSCEARPGRVSSRACAGGDGLHTVSTFGTEADASSEGSTEDVTRERSYTSGSEGEWRVRQLCTHAAHSVYPRVCRSGGRQHGSGRQSGRSIGYSWSRKCRSCGCCRRRDAG